MPKRLLALSLLALSLALFPLLAQPEAGEAEPPGYVLAQVAIEDRDGYRRYEQGFLPILQRFEGKIRVVSESPETLEGEWFGTRTVVLEFPSVKRARAWYESEAYQELARFRHRTAKANIVLVAGR